MLIGTINKIKQQSSLNIYINETILENVDTHKLMGVYIYNQSAESTDVFFSLK